MAKIAEIGDVCQSKDGERLVLKVQAEEISVKAYDGTVITKKKGEYLDVGDYESVVAGFNYLLQNDHISQDAYDSKLGYLEKIKSAFRARISIRK